MQELLQITKRKHGFCRIRISETQKAACHRGATAFERTSCVMRVAQNGYFGKRALIWRTRRRSAAYCASQIMR